MLNQLNLMGNCMGKKGKASHNVTLAILGLDNAGKTVTTKGLQGEPLDTVAPTIGFSSVDFRFEKYNIKLFDLGGGKKIRGIWRNYFSEVYGVIYVIDSSEPERIEECATVLEGLIQHPKVAGKPLLVLANKQDVKGAMDDVDIVEGLRLESLVNQHKCPCRLYKKCPHLKRTTSIYEGIEMTKKCPAKLEMCSALLGQGKKLDRSIKAGMQWLLAYIAADWTDLDERVAADMAEQREIEKREKRERTERVRKIREERERKEREERLAKGEPEEVEDEPEPDFTDGGPFKRLDVNELTEKEQRLKEEKRRKKAEKAKAEAEAEVESVGSVSRKSSKRKQRQVEGEDEVLDESPAPQSYSQNPGKSNLNNSRDNGGRLPKLPASDAENSSKDGENEEQEEEEEEHGGLGSRWRKQRGGRSSSSNQGTPRPEDLSAMSAPAKRGGSLTPIGHLQPLENYAESTSKKKKKKKAKKNQTLPISDSEDMAPRGWPSNSMHKASRSPDLNTTHEDKEEDFQRKYGLLNDDLGVEDDEEASNASTLRRSRPNSEYDDDIVT